jgi:cytochrome c2
MHFLTGEILDNILLCTFCLDTKSTKKVKPGPALPDIVGTGQANAQEHSEYL